MIQTRQSYTRSLALSVPSCRSHHEASCHSALFSLCFYTPPPCFPRGPPWHGRPPSLRLCEYNRLSFRWQSSPVLLALSHLSHNKTYVLKHVPTLCRGFIPPECGPTVPTATAHLPSFHLGPGVGQGGL